MEDELQVITTRLPKKIIEYVEKIAKEEHLDKASLYRKFLYNAVEADKLKRTIEKFQQHQISLLDAAKDAEMPVSVFIDELIRRNIRWGIGLEEYRDGKDILTKKRIKNNSNLGF